MLAHPQTRNILLRQLLGNVVPIQGGACNTPAGDVMPGTFGAGCGGGNYGIGVDPPAAHFHVRGGLPVAIFETITGDGQVTLVSWNGIALLKLVSSAGSGNFEFGRGGNKVGWFSDTLGKQVLTIDNATGNVDIGGLNQIVFLKPLGGINDDRQQIQDAINGLASAHGGIIMLTPETFNIGSTLNVNTDGIKIRGYGGADSATPVTKLLWKGPNGGTVVSAGIGIQYIELSDLAIDGNADIDGLNGAGVGLNVDGVTNSRFKNLSIYNVNPANNTTHPEYNGVGLKLKVTTGATLSWNVFERITVHDAWKGIVLDSTRLPNVVNPAHNTFITINAQRITEFGIELGDCDNNCFHDVTTPGPLNEQSPGAKAGVLVDLAISAGGSPWARSNYFYHLQAGGQKGLVAINAPPAAAFQGKNKNLVFGYDLENAEEQPRAFSSSGFSVEVFNVRDYFSWTDSVGVMHGFPMDASEITSGRMADARMPVDVVMMKDGSTKKLACGSVLAPANSNTPVNTGLSSITTVCVTHLISSANNNRALGSAYNISGGSFQINNEADTNEYFYWIAIGT